MLIYFEGLEDYSIDSRGDVGSWIREGCIRGLEAFLFEYLASNETLAFLNAAETPVFWNRLIGNLCRQAVEKIDRVRDAAGQTLCRILWGLSKAPIKRAGALKAILEE